MSTPQLREAALLPPEQSARLIDWARACKAAARAVALYPPSHPASAATLARIVGHTSIESLAGPLRITVLPEVLLLDGRAPDRADRAVGELASLLHDHLVGEIVIHPGGSAGSWRGFLMLLARSPEALRADGGIARQWTTIGSRHLEVREIDYAEVLRERRGGESAVWERVIQSCLHAEAFDLTPEAIQALVDIAGDPQRWSLFVAALVERGAALATRTAALVSMLRGVAGLVAKQDPGRLEGVLRNMAAAIGQVPPDLMLELLAERARERAGLAAAPLVGALMERMTDDVTAQFVARSLAAGDSPIEGIAEALHALVPEPDRRERLVELSYELAAASPLSRTEHFAGWWEQVADLLRSDADASHGSHERGREPPAVRGQAVDVERTDDDPPERLAAWLTTVSAGAVRALDLTLLLDLLTVEDDPGRWRDLLAPATAHVEDLLLVGDFEAADRLVRALAIETGSAGADARRAAATEALDRLANGATMAHIVLHLATIDDHQFAYVTSLCTRFGATLVRPLAEALSIEERGRTRERLIALLLAFGPTGRHTVERLKHSANPAVRRTAVHLLREFGGTGALPDLTALLDDREPLVQREAVRAILSIGTDAAYGVLEEALSTGSAVSRDAIMRATGLARDERATPLFAYILHHVEPRGPLRTVYRHAIESLGALGDNDGVAALKAALHRGEWWAPRRTTALRRAAARALARIGTPDALAVLQEAQDSGPRRLRAIVRPALAGRRRRTGHGQAR